MTEIQKLRAEVQGIKEMLIYYGCSYYRHLAPTCDECNRSHPMPTKRHNLPQGIDVDGRNICLSCAQRLYKRTTDIKAQNAIAIWVMKGSVEFRHAMIDSGRMPWLLDALRRCMR